MESESASQRPNHFQETVKDFHKKPHSWKFVREDKQVALGRFFRNGLVIRHFFRNPKGEALVLVMRIRIDFSNPEEPIVVGHMRPLQQNEQSAVSE